MSLIFGIPNELDIGSILTVAGVYIGVTGNRFQYGSGNNSTLMVSDSGAWTTPASLLLTSGQLAFNTQASGSALYQMILGLSGFDLSDFATIANLQLTGQNLQAQILGLSGYANNTFATIVNLGLTGQQAWNSGALLLLKINSQSGYAEGIYVHRSGDELITGNKTFFNRIGIGIAPTVPLHVSGQSLFQGNGLTPIVQIQSDADNVHPLYIFNQSGFILARIANSANAGQFILRNAGGDTVQFAANGTSYLTGGSLGIGTTNPAATTKLMVSGGDVVFGNGSRRTDVYIQGTLNQFDAQLYLTEGNAAGGGLYYDSTNNRMYINAGVGGINASSGDYKITLLRDSINVGLGTLNPSAHLHVTGNIRSDVGFFSGTQNFGDLFYAVGNPSGFITGLAGTGSLASLIQLFNTGSLLYNNLTGLSGVFNNTVASLSAIKISGSSIISIANFTGIGGTLVFSSGGFIFISGGAGGGGGNGDGINLSGNMTLTGQTLLNDILGLSGNVVFVNGNQSINNIKTFTNQIIAQNFATNDNALTIFDVAGTSRFGVVKTFGSFPIVAYSSGAPLQFWRANSTGPLTLGSISGGSGITALTFDSFANIVVGIGLYISGSAPLLQSQTGQFYPASNPSGFVLASQVSGVGVFAPAGANYIYQTGTTQLIVGGFNVSGNMIITGGLIISGASILTQINSTLANLLTTGQSLYNYVVGLSGWADSLLVHRTGNEFITGNKTFLNSVIFAGGSQISGNGGSLYLTQSGLGDIIVPSGNVVLINSPSAQAYWLNAAKSAGMGYNAGSIQIVLYSAGQINSVLSSTDTRLSSNIQFGWSSANAAGGGGISAGNDTYFVRSAPSVIGTNSSLLVSGNVNITGIYQSGGVDIFSLFYPRSNPSGYGTGAGGGGITQGQLDAVSGWVDTIVVHRFGTEFITGNKTFVNSVGINNAPLIEALNVSGSIILPNNTALKFYSKNGVNLSAFSMTTADNFQIGTQSGSNQIFFNTAGLTQFFTGNGATVATVMIINAVGVGVGAAFSNFTEKFQVSGGNIRVDGGRFHSVSFTGANARFENPYSTTTYIELATSGCTGYIAANGNTPFRVDLQSGGQNAIFAVITSHSVGQIGNNDGTSILIRSYSGVGSDPRPYDLFLGYNTGLGYGYIDVLHENAGTEANFVFNPAGYNGGNVGISDSNPQNRLSISGNVAVNGGVFLSGGQDISTFYAPAVKMLNVTGNFTANTVSRLYIWSGSATWTGTLPTPSTASGSQIIIKNLSKTSNLFLTGMVDYSQNYSLLSTFSLTLISDNFSWIAI